MNAQTRLKILCFKRLQATNNLHHCTWNCNQRSTAISSVQHCLLDDDWSSSRMEIDFFCNNNLTHGPPKTWKKSHRLFWIGCLAMPPGCASSGSVKVERSILSWPRQGGFSLVNPFWTESQSSSLFLGVLGSGASTLCLAPQTAGWCAAFRPF